MATDPRILTPVAARGRAEQLRAIASDMQQLAQAIAERDRRIAELEEENANLLAEIDALRGIVG